MLPTPFKRRPRPCGAIPPSHISPPAARRPQFSESPPLFPFPGPAPPPGKHPVKAGRMRLSHLLTSYHIPRRQCNCRRGICPLPPVEIVPLPLAFLLKKKHTFFKNTSRNGLRLTSKVMLCYTETKADRPRGTGRNPAGHLPPEPHGFGIYYREWRCSYGYHDHHQEVSSFG